MYLNHKKAEGTPHCHVYKYELILKDVKINQYKK